MDKHTGMVCVGVVPSDRCSQSLGALSIPSLQSCLARKGQNAENPLRHSQCFLGICVGSQEGE